MYEAINKEIGVYSCSITDLKPVQTNHFLKLWNDGSSIESLTVFNDSDGKIVINKDHKHFETFKGMVLDYMKSTKEEKEEIKVSVKSEAFKSIFIILDNVLKYKEKKKKDEEFKSLKKILEKQYIPFSALQTIWNIYDSHKPGSDSLELIALYNYGVMQGKRVERAKKKRLQIEVTA